jgi:hypothetical protein
MGKGLSVRKLLASSRLSALAHTTFRSAAAATSKVQGLGLRVEDFGLGFRV